MRFQTFHGEELIAAVQRKSSILLYDIDDDLIQTPSEHPDAVVHRAKAAVVRYMVEHADTVWVSTKELANRLPTTKRPACIVPTGSMNAYGSHPREPVVPIKARYGSLIWALQPMGRTSR